MDDPIPFYRQYLQLQGATFSLIDHEDATVGIVYKVNQPDGQEFILKICTRPNDYLREVYFLEHLAGLLSIPRIQRVVPLETGSHGAILMECLKGKLLDLVDLTDALAYEIGVALARVHVNRTAGYGDLTKPSGLSPDPRIPFTLKFEEGFSECSYHLPKMLLDQCYRYYEAHVDLLTLVDGPCMIHRDFRPGNVMVYEGRLQGIIDWASGRASFAEEDFCPMEHGEWGSLSTIKNAFLAGYASIRPVPNYTALMPFLRLSRALGTMGFMIKNGTWNSLHARVYRFNRQFLDTLFR